MTNAPAFSVVPPPPRWLAAPANRRLVGRVLFGVVAGIIGGVSLARSEAADVRMAERLTKAQYVADFEAHKAKLLKSDPSVAVDVFACVIAVLAAAALYEAGGVLLAPVVGWADDSFAHRSANPRGVVLDDTDL